MSIGDFLLGKPLASSELKKEELTPWTGMPLLGLDSLASTGYGPEAALTVLATAGISALHYFPVIVIVLVAQLLLLYFSYRQTAEAYPNGGGAYNVAKDNFGEQTALWAAVALLLDYLLNVAVGISAGIGAVVSAIPRLQPHTLTLCLLVLISLAVVNLRGVRESGRLFLAPVFLFVGCMAAVIGIGLIKVLQSGGHPHAVIPPPVVSQTGTGLGIWLLLAAFANGCTAMTGVEAVSNGVPLFREPKVLNAHKTLTATIVILSVFLLGLGYLCPAYQIVGMNEQAPGYQTVISQVVAAVAGRNVFYYLALISTFIVLTYSAQTSFADFPRVCHFLAEDKFLPPAFSNRGRRLVFSAGIIVLAVLSALLLLAFGGITDKLIPLFAIGAFGAFLFSQLGMVRHWLRNRGPRFRAKLFFNALGALGTSIVLAVIVIAKLKEGAWITLMIAPAAVLVLRGVRRHYWRIEKQVSQAPELQTSKLQAPAVIVPIFGWDRASAKAMQFALFLSQDVTAVHISYGGADKQRLAEEWAEKVETPAKAAHITIPRLVMIDSPYRRIHQPIIDFVSKTLRERPNQLIAVVTPELAEPHWYGYLLHNLHAARLRAELFLKGDERVVVINTPWRLRDA